MLIVRYWYLQDPIVLDFYDFGFRCSLYEELVARFCVVLFVFVAVNTVSQLYSIFFDSFKWYGTLDGSYQKILRSMLSKDFQ